MSLSKPCWRCNTFRIDVAQRFVLDLRGPVLLCANCWTHVASAFGKRVAA